MAISDAESRFLFVTFFDPHSIVGTDEVQLDESLCLAQSV